QPPAQVTGGFIGCGSIERHHGPGSSGGALQLRAPLVAADAGDLDDELASIDDFFEAVLYHRRQRKVMWVSGHSSGRTGTIKRKDRRRRINTVQPPPIPCKLVENFVRSSARPQA